MQVITNTLKALLGIAVMLLMFAGGCMMAVLPFIIGVWLWRAIL